MRRRDGTDDQSGEDWLTWLRRIITTRGYDIDSPRGGGSTRLATDTGLAPSSVSRILTGSAPNFESCVILARTLELSLPELLIRTGKADPEDFPQTGSSSGQRGVLSGKPLSPEEVAIAAGVPVGDRDWFETMVRRLRKESSHEGTTGGAAARG